MEQNKITAISALCKFDLLVQKHALKRKDRLTHSQKRELDLALSERERVCTMLGLSASKEFG
jgi:hypothetical protein